MPFSESKNSRTRTQPDDVSQLEGENALTVIKISTRNVVEKI